MCVCVCVCDRERERERECVVCFDAAESRHRSSLSCQDVCRTGAAAAAAASGPPGASR